MNARTDTAASLQLPTNVAHLSYKI